MYINRFMNLALVFLLFLNTNFASANQYAGHASYVPAGTPVSVSMSTTLGSEFSQVGQSFTASLSGPVYAGGQVIAPPGSQVQGVITAIQPAGRGGKPGSMDLRLVNIITPTGARIPLSATVDKVNFKLEADGGRTSNYVKATAAGAAGGALSGLIGSAISGGKKGKGAAIGTGIGAGVGLLGGTLRKGKELLIQQGMVIPFRLDTPIQVGNSAPPVQQLSPNDYGSYGNYQAPQQQYQQSYPQTNYAPPPAPPSQGFADPTLPGGNYQQQEPINPYL